MHKKRLYDMLIGAALTLFSYIYPLVQNSFLPLLHCILYCTNRPFFLYTTFILLLLNLNALIEELP